jgi:hypothetical protein
VKLATVASDVMGVSGREMMCALIERVADCRWGHSPRCAGVPIPMATATIAPIALGN